jgi:nitrogen fixation NifU-like protein
MNTDLRDIYRETVLEHSRHPHNYRPLKDASHEALGFNPLCGDKLRIYLNLDKDKIAAISFEGTGCAIAIASASMMTDALDGCSTHEANDRIKQVSSMLAEGSDELEPELSTLRALEGVRNYPSRIKCATLAWSAAQAALHGDAAEISTEE